MEIDLNGNFVGQNKFENLSPVSEKKKPFSRLFRGASYLTLLSITFQISVAGAAIRLQDGRKFEPIEILRKKVKHIVVLMMENRSFDHRLGGVGLKNNYAITDDEFEHPNEEVIDLRHQDTWGAHKYKMTVDAPNSLEFDLPHEFWEVLTQVPPTFWANAANLINLGEHFIQSAMDWVDEIKSEKDPILKRLMAMESMKAFKRESVPVLSTLAEEFAVADMTFAPIPGPTFPNRYFVHAGTSGGLKASPGTENLLDMKYESYDKATVAGFKFRAGSIYDQLKDSGIRWKIYHDDHTPQVLTVDKMLERYLLDTENHFGSLDEEFARDVANGTLPPYSFLEPKYGDLNNFSGGNSEHPIGDVRDGEELIRKVYHIIRNSQLWEETLFIITYDEHGGFGDHVRPPAAVPTGDDDQYADKPLKHGEHANAKNRGGEFLFDRLGVRIPAVIISPYIRKGTIDRRIHDSTAILKTVQEKFEADLVDSTYGKSLTMRDLAATSYAKLLTLDTPRTDCIETLEDPWKGEFHQLHKQKHRKKADPAFLYLTAHIDFELQKLKAEIDEADQEIKATPRTAEAIKQQHKELFERAVASAKNVKSNPEDSEEYFRELHQRILEFKKTGTEQVRQSRRSSGNLADGGGNISAATMGNQPNQRTPLLPPEDPDAKTCAERFSEGANNAWQKVKDVGTQIKTTCYGE